MTQVGTLGTPPPPPPNTPMTPYIYKAPKPKRPVRSVRLTASTLVLFGTILLAVSMGVSWWGYSTEGAGGSDVHSFLPGNSYQVTGGAGGTTVTNTDLYSATGLVHVGQMYEAVLGIGLLAVVLGLVAVVLGYAGAVTKLKKRSSLNLTLILVLVALIAAVGLPTFVALAQPGTFNSDVTAGGAGTCGATPNPCGTFWGSFTGGGTTSSWGADLGWYLALAAAVLFLVAFLQFARTRREPYTQEEIVVAATRAAEVPASSSSLAGSLLSDDRGVAPSQGKSVNCPKCGNPMTWVSQYSRWYCNSERTYI